MNKAIEYHFSSIPDETLFLQITKRIVELGSGKILEMLDGLDGKYWDIRIRDEILTIHSETFLGIVGFMRNGAVISDSLFSILQDTKATIFTNIRDLGRAFPRVVDLFSNLSKDFANGKFESISVGQFQSRCESKDVERTIKEYGRQLIPIPEEEIEKTELLILNDGRGFVGDLSFWTKEEGRSDLSLIFTIEQNKIQIDDIRVM